MAKRLRQTCLNLPSKRQEVHSVEEVDENEDLSFDQGMDFRLDDDVEGTESSTEESQEVTDCECQSSCCTNEVKPYQPTNKTILSSMAKNGRNFIDKWYNTFPWLTICTTRKKVFCFYCKKAKNRGLLSFSTKAESTFTNIGFDNWKKALEKFRSHSHCSAHAESVLKCQMLETAPISQQLSSQLQKEQSYRRQALLKQLHCLRFLLRQGLAIRGHTEVEGNLQQLLIMWSAYDSSLKRWLKENKYLSPVIVNELITTMGLSVLRSLLKDIQTCSPAWYAIIADEATDAANREQLNVSIRWVNSDYEVSEDPVGLYCLPDTKSDTLYSVVTDILTRCTLPLCLCRGQAYDGASNMQGTRNGLASKIRKDVPAALPVHCLAHCLNLCLQDAGRKLPFLRDALDTVREVVKLIKLSPKRAHLFSEKLAQPDNSGVTLKPLCPTRWTARTEAIGAVINDYSILMEALDEIHQTTRDEYGLKAAGLLSALEKFSMLFGLKLGYLVFGASETLSKSLQGKDTSLQEAISAVNLAKKFYRRQRTEEAFSQFYDKVVDAANELDIAKPQLPRYRRAPRRLDDGSQPHQYNGPKDFFRHQYFQACDLLLQELEDRFEQRQLLPPVISLENLFLEAANGKPYEKSIQDVQSSCYKDDINFELLQKQLPLLADLVHEGLPSVKEVTSVRTICDAMNTQSVYKSLLSEVHNLLRLYLTIPVTSATSERSFSALKRVLTYLRSSMSEKRLNNCLLLHVHKQLTDSCDMEEIAKEFVTANIERRNYFGVFC